MVASSISTPDSALPIVVSTSKLIEFNGKHFIPSPSLEAKTKKLWEAQVMIPYSFSEKSLAFADPTTDREHGFALTTAKATSSATKAKRIISNVAKPSLHNKSASMTSGLKQSTSASNPPTKDTYPTKDTTSSK
ncbi:hypothetical protein JHK87_055770 [Glycine soja]|nr:hypothetical protein JHK87_055770 [Glycine soja]